MLVQLVLIASVAAAPAPPIVRHVHIEQSYTVPAGKAATLWVPLPVDDPWQTVTGLAVDAKFEEVHDPRDGNAAARIEVPAAGGVVHVSFDVFRRERSADLARANGAAAPNGYARWLQGDRLVEVDARVTRIADEVTAGAKTPLEKARAIYAYVLKTMRYDKHGKGWGAGSIVWACDAKYGNCTDFHALLIGLLRASGIPARFQIGYPIPSGASGEIPGYHCWADFYLDGAGWIPVDASEGWKDPSRRDYFFGHHDANRFALSTGRDIAFPGMRSATPMNYFVYAYAEDAQGASIPVAHATRFTEKNARE